MITLNQQIVTAKEQNIKFNELKITGGFYDTLRAEVTFIVTNENGEIIGNKYIVAEGVDFNDFWTNFNSASYLYQKLADKESLPVTIDTATTDASFTNVVPTEDTTVTE